MRLFQSVKSNDPCLDGVVDLAGACCRGYLDAITGLCCNEGETVDSSGACCSNPLGVDACGHCGGSSVAVDILGTCCNTALAPSGLCCQLPAEIDSCGVCGGVNQCTALVSVSVSFRQDQMAGAPANGSTVLTPNQAALVVSEATGVPSTLLSPMTIIPVTNTTVRV